MGDHFVIGHIDTRAYRYASVSQDNPTGTISGCGGTLFSSFAGQPLSHHTSTGHASDSGLTQLPPATLHQQLLLQLKPVSLSASFPPALPPATGTPLPPSFPRPQQAQSALGSCCTERPSTSSPPAAPSRYPPAAAALLPPARSRSGLCQQLLQ